MPDISLCRDEDCPSRLRCFRFVAKPSEPQTYAEFERHGYRCESFLEVVKTTKPK